MEKIKDLLDDLIMKIYQKEYKAAFQLIQRL